MGQKLVQYRLGMLSSLLFSFFCLMLWESRWVGGGQCFWTDGNDTSHDWSPRIPVREVIFFPLAFCSA